MNTAIESWLEMRMRIEELYARYAACLDDGAFEAWPDFFTEECTYRIVPRENFARGLPLATLSFESRAMLIDRVYGITQTLFHEPYYQRHIISGILIEAHAAGGFAVRANYLVIRTKASTPSEVYNTGQYRDHIVDEDGTLRFVSKIAVFDSELIANSMIYPI